VEAINFIGIIGEANGRDLGAALQRLPRALHLQVFDKNNLIAILPVAVLNFYPGLQNGAITGLEPVTP
jgi:hypothetical protein